MVIEFKTPDGDLVKKFKNLTSPRDVANMLEIKFQALSYIIYRIPEVSKYQKFNIPKKRGGVREINSPVGPLKSVQRKLNYVFHLADNPKPAVHSFIRGRSIVTNAKMHMRQNWVLNLDLQDFFPSIHFGRVQGVFKSPPFSFPGKVATLLAQICCYNGTLPQGAPTSPMVSNFICKRMDGELQRLAKRNRCFYTRYADDITFSTSRKQFPKNLAYRNENGKLIIGNELNSIIVEKNNFDINNKKVWLFWRGGRQLVTGLKVNEFPNVNEGYIKQLKAMLNAWEKYGHDKAHEEHYRVYAKIGKFRNPEKTLPPFREIVRGKILFLKMVRGKNDLVYIKLYNKLVRLEPKFGDIIEIDKGPLMKHDFEFDVFMAHNGKDKKTIRHIANDLKRDGIIPWLDEWEILPGRMFQDEIEKAFPKIKTAAVFVGKHGVSPWERMEMRLAINQFLRRDVSVIPVLLPGVKELPSDLLMLQEFSWVKFSSLQDKEALKKLISGIKGVKKKNEPKKIPFWEKVKNKFM